MLVEAIKEYWLPTLLMALAGAIIGAGIAALFLLGEDVPFEPKQTICVEGTFLQPDNTCLPSNSISLKDK